MASTKIEKDIKRLLLSGNRPPKSNLADKFQKLVGSSKNGKPVVIREEQSEEKLKREVQVKYVGNNITSTLLASAGAPLDISIKAGYPGIAESCFLELQVAEMGGSNGVAMSPGHLCIEHIDWLGNGGSERIQRQYGFLMWILMNLFSDEQMRIYGRYSNESEHWGSPPFIPASGSRTFYIPLIGSFFENVKPFLGNLKSDIICRIQFAASVESGSGTLALQACNLWVQYEELHSGERKTLEDDHKKNVVEATVINHYNQRYASQALASGTQYTFKWDGFNAQIPFFVQTIRSSTANASKGSYTFADIGKLSPIEIIDDTGNNIVGGSTLTNAMLHEIAGPNFAGRLLEQHPAIVPFIFCDNLQSVVFEGERNGMLHFQDDVQTRFTPAASTETACVFKIVPVIADQTATAAGKGVFVISFGGYTTQPLAYNSTAAVIQSALRDLESVKKANLTVTVSGIMDATGSTITISNAKEPLHLHGWTPFVSGSLASSSDAALFPKITNETAGKANALTHTWTNGTYTVDGYALAYRKVHYDDGRFSVMDA